MLILISNRHHVLVESLIVVHAAEAHFIVQLLVLRDRTATHILCPAVLVGAELGRGKIGSRGELAVTSWQINWRIQAEARAFGRCASDDRVRIRKLHNTILREVPVALRCSQLGHLLLLHAHPQNVLKSIVQVDYGHLDL